MIVALNIFCMIADMHLLLLLTLFWKQIEGSFGDNASYIEEEKSRCMPVRLFLPFTWFLCYTPYFIYLLITQNMYESNSLSDLNRVFFYIVCQLIC